eukprot:scaffold143224_cov118-Phaeocystis_antarctica.AAC.1
MVVTLDVSRLSGWLNADAERNMTFMPLTLDVSRLSGWLNADAEKNMPLMSVTLDVSRLSGWLNTDAPRNISPMVVTLEVLKLSGWLNAGANCREPKVGHAVWGGVRASRRGRCVQRAAEARLQIGGKDQAWSAPGTSGTCS